jgi:hypothetical protein
MRRRTFCLSQIVGVVCYANCTGRPDLEMANSALPPSDARSPCRRTTALENANSDREATCRRCSAAIDGSRTGRFMKKSWNSPVSGSSLTGWRGALRHNVAEQPPLISMRTRRSRIKRKPARGTLVRYQDRIAEVLGDARGERVMIRSVHADGVERRTAVKWVNLVPLDQQLF